LTRIQPYLAVSTKIFEVLFDLNAGAVIASMIPRSFVANAGFTRDLQMGVVVVNSFCLESWHYVPQHDRHVGRPFILHDGPDGFQNPHSGHTNSFPGLYKTLSLHFQKKLGYKV
jgi:hypothetical protein